MKPNTHKARLEADIGEARDVLDELVEHLQDCDGDEAGMRALVNRLQTIARDMLSEIPPFCGACRD